MQESPSVAYNDVRPKPMWAEAADRQASWMEFTLTQLDAFRGPVVREVRVPQAQASCKAWSLAILENIS